MHVTGDKVIQAYLIPLSRMLSSLPRYLKEQTTSPLDTAVHESQTGDSICV